jgi:hypothetical protein
MGIIKSWMGATHFLTRASLRPTSLRCGIGGGRLIALCTLLVPDVAQEVLIATGMKSDGPLH